MALRTVIYQQSGSSFLRPDECGSAVHWNVTFGFREKYNKTGTDPKGVIHGTIQLTDCIRMISWNIACEEDLSKLDRAIAELRAARAALAKAVKKEAVSKDPDEKS